MALSESTVNPWTSGQEDGLHNSLSTVLPRELSALFCSAYNGEAVVFLMSSLTELYLAISDIGLVADKWLKGHVFFRPL